MNVARAVATGTVLANGFFLVAGGLPSVSGGPTESAEIYNPTLGGFTLTGDLSTFTYRHAATALEDGTAMIVDGLGGSGGSTFLNLGELYDPATNDFTLTNNNVPFATEYLTAVTLQTGDVLAVGGTTNGSTPSAKAALYIPEIPAIPTFREITNRDLQFAIFGPSGVNDAPGAVPDPGTTAGTTRFLREDATWDIPPGAGFANPMTTEGDIIYENATPAPARLPIGSTGQVLTVAGGIPSWATPSTPTSAGGASPYSRRWSLVTSSPTLLTAGNFMGDQNGAQFATIASHAVFGSPSFTCPTSLLSTNSNNTDFGYIAGSLQWPTGGNIIFQTKLAVNKLTSIRIRFGVADTVTPATLFNSDTISANFAGFRFSSAASDTNWQCQTSGGSTNTTVDSGVAVTANTLYLFQVQFNDSIPNIVFSINKTVVATITTHLPSASVGLGMFAGGESLAATTTGIYVAWLYAEADS
jgi:hypothetical protein